MFRPSKETLEANIAIAVYAAQLYGLSLPPVYRTKTEIWLAKDYGDLKPLYEMDENTPEWHTYRAQLCGVKDVDPKFHERQGYNGPQ